MPFPPGYRHSAVTRAKIKRNNVKYWQGTEGAFKGRRHTEEAKEKIRAKLLGRPRSPETLQRMADSQRGKKNSVETRRRKSAAQHRRYGTTTKAPQRDRVEYFLWREQVLHRANGICQECWTPYKKLEADHVKPWALYPELRYIVENGRGLCKACHLRVGWRGSHVKRS